MGRKRKQQNVSTKRFVKNSPTAVGGSTLQLPGNSSSSKPKYTIGITAADQFNIVLFHASYVERELSMLVTTGTESSAEYDAFEDKTKSVHIVSPTITCIEHKDLQTSFLPGKLYTVTVDSISFFTTGEMNRQWPDDWHALDIFLEKGAYLVFLGVVKYELFNNVTKRKNDIYSLRFLHNETIVQYPVFQQTYKDSLDFAENVRSAIRFEKIQTELLSVLTDKLEPV